MSRWELLRSWFVNWKLSVNHYVHIPPFIDTLFLKAHLVHQLIEAKWRTYASVKRAIFVSYNGMTPVRRQASILNHRWDVDKGMVLDIISETWNKIKQFHWSYTFEDVMYKAMSIFTRPRCVREHPFVSTFFLWIMIVRKASFTNCDWWLSWQRLNALMMISRLCYIANLKHVLPSVHCNDVNMNICISME